MNSVKLSTGKYQDYLIASLRDPKAAAAYLSAILEEANPEPGLFRDAMVDVATALGTPELRIQVEQLQGDRATAVEDLNACLMAMGLQLVITTVPHSH